MRFAPTTIAFGVVVAVILLGALLGATAQESGGAGESRTYGTAALVTHTMQAAAFTPFTKSDTLNVSANLAGDRFCDGADNCSFVAPVLLPAGAVVISLQLDACDTRGSAAVTASLQRSQRANGGTVNLAQATTGFGPSTFGCALVTSQLASPSTINNDLFAYFVRVSIASTGPALEDARFQAVRIFYRLQVSPAPAVATFNDVPTTHPFFPFIEALVAAGITAGCDDSPPLFCPDAAVTRKQMAAFLARALGLHWPLSTGIGGDGQ